jgi:general secretion pathway protein E
MRLLDKQAGRLGLGQLGMAARDLAAMRNIISKPHGIILVTGPTGSGKTTTLYGALSDLNDTSRNILTVEDPVEYSLPGIGQTQVNLKADMTFAKGLRAILRQDPDVVMIGEIRDLDTVEIAIQASLTGHLVLSTLHTNTAVGAITRLQDMGVEPFLLSSSVIGVIAQRLVRVLCNDCKTSTIADASECKILDADEANPPKIFHAKGCEKCNQLGYRGRQGIYEIIEVDEKLKTLIHDQVGEQDLERHARVLGPSIRQDGIRKVLAGSTTIEELLRVAKA